VRGLADIYAQQFKVTMASFIQYRAALVIWLIGHVLEPLIYLVVWSNVSRSTAGGSVGGFTAADFAAYFIVLMVVNHMTYTWIMYEYEYRVREGTLSPDLLRPVHPIHSDIADNITSKLITLPGMLVIAVLLGFVFRPAFRLVPWAAAAFVPVVLLAFLVRFFTEWTRPGGLLTTRTSALNQMYFMAMLFFSGEIAPLELLPHPVRVIAFVLPFRWTIGFPTELLLGRLTPAQTLTGVGMQMVWLAAGLVLMRFVWRAGLKVYSAVGA
jgi:ABC-2 type transport system permease protein